MTYTRSFIVASVAMVAMVGLGTPLSAQRERDGRSGGGTAERRGGPRNEAPAPRNDAPAVRPAPQDRGPAPAPAPAPQNQGNGRTFQNQRPVPGAAVPPQPLQPPQQRFAPRAVPRPEPAPRNYDGRSYNNGGNSPRYQYNERDRYQAPRYVAPRAVPYSYNYSSPYRYGRSYNVRPPVFTQRYYTFRPQFRLGFGGLSVGFGFAYPFQYWDPYASYNYRIGVVPGYGAGNYYSRVGGLSFEIDPYDAAVFVDGEYVGVAQDFNATQMPLTLSVGRHHIDMQADGYLDASFDITIVGGQVIPYEGSLAMR